jgi:hypothetical protein
MTQRGLDPFSPVERKLGELECDRSRLRPDEAIRLTADEAGSRNPVLLPEPGQAAERMSPGACRKAFEALFGLDHPASPEPVVD